MSEEKIKRCWICTGIIPSDRPYYTKEASGQTVYNHVGCQIGLDTQTSRFGLDATDLRVEPGPIVWLYCKVISGRAVEATIRQYEPNLFCWITICDDGYLHSTRNSDIAETIEEAKQAVEDNILYYLLYC